jgi:hypothetical protein
MTNGLRGRSRSLPMLGVVFACVSWLPACGLLLGLDQGATGLGDASSDAVTVPVANGEDAPVANGEPVADGEGEGTGSTSWDAPSSDAPSSVDATTGDPIQVPAMMDGGDEASSGPLEGDGCTPDPSWCDSHCGTGLDNCGETRQCASDCQQSYVCGPKNTCDCQTEMDWCTGRCGQTTDNCGNAIDCGTCDAGGCTAESTREACGSRQCGQATNNCGQLVNCGLLGTALCSNLLQQCLDDGGCCSPNNASACGNQCGTVATNSCGKSVLCTCGAGSVCVDNTCCKRTDPCDGTCGVTLTDNCGQEVQCACFGSDECVSNTCVPRNMHR